MIFVDDQICNDSWLKNCGRVKSIHIPRARVEQWPLVFKVELCKVYHQYKL